MLTVADVRRMAAQLRSAPQRKFSLPLRDDVRLTVSGVVWIPGMGFMHPASFKDTCGNAAYRELLRRPRVVTEYDEVRPTAAYWIFSGGLMVKPTIGRIVIYKYPDSVRCEHVNGASECPAVVVRVWSDTCVNLKLIEDGPFNSWKTSVSYDGSGKQGFSWRWPGDAVEETK